MVEQKSHPPNSVFFHHSTRPESDNGGSDSGEETDQDFLLGFIRHSNVDAFFHQSIDPLRGQEFASFIDDFDSENRGSTFVPLGRMGRLVDFPDVLSASSLSLGAHAWRRRTSASARSYSICGRTGILSSATAMDNMGELLTAPLQAWDAAVCTSTAAKKMMTRLIDNWADYLGRRSGGKFKTDLQMPIIPNGVDCLRFGSTNETDEARSSIRRGLGIVDEDLAVLYVGPLDYHNQAHPMAMYLALEEAVARTGKKIHLLQVGRFPNPEVEREFRDGIRRYCPSVNGIFLDNRDVSVSKQVWFAADIFTSLTDTIGRSSAKGVLKGMAAGLPVVVSDWGENKDCVRHGEDGFRIPTWLPLPDSGTDMAIDPESRLIEEVNSEPYADYCGSVSQSTSIDIAAAADAYAALAIDPALRERLGSSAQKRAREHYDWSVIIATHQDLWLDLSNRRNATVESAATVQGQPLNPLRDDPFSLFADYATHTVDGDAIVSIAAPEIESGQEINLTDRMAALRAVSMNDYAASSMLNDDDIATVLALVEQQGPVSVIALAEPLSEDVRFKLPRTLTWLSKIGLFQLQQPGASETPSTQSQKSEKPEAQSLVDLGARARSRGAIEAAADYFTKALRADPGHAEANFHYGELHALTQSYDHAEDFLRRAVKAEDGYVDARRSLGKVLFLRNKDSDAVRVLSETADMVPNDAETHYLLGAGYRRGGKANDAVTHLKKAIEINPRRVDAHAHLALAYKTLGLRDNAILTIQNAIEIDPSNVFSRAMMASLQIENKGRQIVEQLATAKRVGFHLNQIYQYPLLKPLFDGFSFTHWPLITGDGRELMEFQPDIVVICDTHAEDLRRLVPNAIIINIGTGLAGKNAHAASNDPGDYLCVPSEHMRDQTIEKMGVAPERLWMIGYPPMDPLFKPGALPLPFETPLDKKTVLYAPTHNQGLTSALQLAGDPVDLILGTYKNANLIIKPHPRLCEQRPGLIKEWQQALSNVDNAWLVTDATLDVAPFLKAADVLLSDASSVIFEYLALDRPIVLINPSKTPRGNASYDADGIEWRWRDIGIQVNDIAYLADAVEQALTKPDANTAIRSDYAAKLFGTLSDGKAMGRLLAKVKEL
jgi:starch synthase